MEVRPKTRNCQNATYTTLKLLDEGHFPAQIARLVGEHKSSTLRRCHILEHGGFLKKPVKSGALHYELTLQGKEFLKTLLRVLGNATCNTFFRRHNLLFKLPVIAGAERLNPQMLSGEDFFARKRGQVRGWEASWPQGQIFFTGSSFLIFPKPIESASLMDAAQKGIELAEKVGARLQKLFPWVKLAWKAEVCREHIAMRGGIAKWIPDGFRYRGDRPISLVVDFSKGEAEVEMNGAFAWEGMSRVCDFLEAVANQEVQAPAFSGNRLEVG